MKRFLIFLAFTLSLLALVACGDNQVCQHRDADDNSLCDKCGESYTDGKDIEECKHSFISSVTKEPTCTEGGEQLYTCSKCEYSYTEAIAANHNIENGFCTRCKLPESTPGLLYMKNKDGAYTVIGIGDCQETSIFIGIYKDSYVTSIDDWAFGGCDDLTSVTIGNSVTSIGNNAFSGCNSLTSVTIGDSVTSIGYYAFYWCDSLTSITIPDSVTSIGDFAFYSCTSLTSVTIGDSVTSIGNNAFSDCTSLTSVTIPGSVKSIGSYAFDDCTSLTYNEYDNAYYLGNEDNPYIILVMAKDKNITSCTIHKNAKLIHSDAFAYCESLASVTIPDSVTSIGNWAFSDCTSLTSVTIPDSVTSIGYGAFHDCTSLASVTFNNPNGWRPLSSDATSTTSITGLSDASLAAEYLRSTYCDYYWRRG